jgi:hypothetical protein
MAAKIRQINRIILLTMIYIGRSIFPHNRTATIFIIYTYMHVTETFQEVYINPINLLIPRRVDIRLCF